jgi:8-oxo-dGTP pyrophosphatase MutT (NUDIX family)
MLLLNHLSPTQTPLHLPVISTKALILSDSGLLLLRKAKGSWDLPGGKCEPGEPLEQAIVREVAEETRLCLPAPRYLGWAYRQRDQRPPLGVAFFAFDLPALLPADIQLSDEHVDVSFLQAAALSGLDMPKLYHHIAYHWLAANSTIP